MNDDAVAEVVPLDPADPRLDEEIRSHDPMILVRVRSFHTNQQDLRFI
jgi:hypothetical protein